MFDLELEPETSDPAIVPDLMRRAREAVARVEGVAHATWRAKVYSVSLN